MNRWLAASLITTCALAGCPSDPAGPLGDSGERTDAGALERDATVLDATVLDATVLDAAAPDATTPDAGPTFTLTSTAVGADGLLPREHTCDGLGTSPPLAWTGVPPGTAELALLMTTVARDGLKWNWVLYHVPAELTALPTGVTDVGTAGLTSDGPELAYSPPCAQGPGAKIYTFTLYALSAAPTFAVPPREVTGAVVTETIAPLILGQAALSVSYTR